MAKGRATGYTDYYKNPGRPVADDSESEVNDYRSIRKTKSDETDARKTALRRRLMMRKAGK